MIWKQKNRKIKKEITIKLSNSNLPHYILYKFGKTKYGKIKIIMINIRNVIDNTYAVYIKVFCQMKCKITNILLYLEI